MTKITFHSDVAENLLIYGFFEDCLPVWKKCPVVPYENSCMIGAVLHAGAASYALVKDDHDQTVIAFICRLGRADIHARRFVAVVAENRQEDPNGVGELPHLLFEHIRLENAGWGIVL
jgi:hypothetical protein